MNDNFIIALLILGVNVINYLEGKKHREWEHSRDQSQRQP